MLFGERLDGRLLILAACATLAVGAFAQLPPPRLAKRHIGLPTAQRQYRPFTSLASGTVKVDITASHVLNRFAPDLALGGAVDAIGAGGEPTLFTTANLNEMLGAGLGSLSYRLYTELNVEDWHWNPAGAWSDSKDAQGYFTGNSTIGGAIDHSFGYFLAHRGSTYDYGSNLKYSNIDDGDPTTYWKSNPYLTSAFTGESDTLHPQWLFFVLTSAQTIDAVRIQWANPYAIDYQVQYWTGDDPVFDPTNGSWVTFPSGTVTNGKGGTVTLNLGAVYTQFVRVVMTKSSGTYDTHGNADPRNGKGYAVYEAGAGSLGANGAFTDYVAHAPNQNQTTVYVSSTDPWHSASSENAATEQIGLDYIFRGNLSKSLPAMAPVPLLFSTPGNALAEIEYLEHRGYPLLGVELGEEPDGQNILPEDYASLWLQWARTIHARYPALKLGGPVTSYNGAVVWANAAGNSDFLSRFVAYLRSHNALFELGFVSTEHYPFYQATSDWSLATQEVSEARSLFSWIAAAEVPKTVPLYVTEYNLSAAPAEPIVDLIGALWHAVFVGEFMKGGGAGSYFYQYLPYEVSNGGTSYGLIGMLVGNDNDQAIAKTSEYFSSQLMSLEWCLPGKGSHSMLPATSSILDSSGNEVVLPYALERPDGLYSLMLVNTDDVAHAVGVSFANTKSHYFTGTVAQAQFSAKDYLWQSNGLNSIASPDGPYEKSTVANGKSATYSLPAHSITVLRGKIL